MLHRVVVASMALAPMAGSAFAILSVWSRGVGVFDLALASVMYVVTGFGVTIGFHRLLTHGAFRPRRGLKIEPRCGWPRRWRSRSLRAAEVRWPKAEILERRRLGARSAQAAACGARR